MCVTAARTTCAVRKARAVSVRVGFTILLVGKTHEPTLQKGGTWCVCPP